MLINKNDRLTIVLPAMSTPREQFAAQELKKYLHMLCGVSTYIASDDAFEGGKAIAIGGPERNCITAGFITETEFDSIVPGPEGIFIKSYGTCLVLAGSSKNLNEWERGTVYAVYEFLERFCGCSLAAYVKAGVPGGEYIPSVPELDLTSIFYAKASCDVPMRCAVAQYSAHGVAQSYDLDFTFLDWLCKNRYNYIYTWNRVYENFKVNGMLEQCLKRGFILVVGHHDTIDTMLPPHGNQYFDEHYYETHPEYYRLDEDGTRFEIVDSWGQMVLCSRNEEMIRQVSQNMIHWLDLNPQVKIYSWSHKDGTAPQCCCPMCKPYSKFENSIYMLNKIAENVAKAHPDVKLCVGAYTDMWEPPESVDTLSPNMMVRESVWHISGLRTTGKPDGSCLNGTFFEENLLNWKQKYDVPVIYYDYFMGVYPGRQRLVPMADELQAIFRRFVEKGIFGCKTQIEVYNLWNNIVNFYTFGRTGYDTQLSLNDNLERFCQIFGKGAPYVADCIRYCEEVLDGQCEIMTAGVYLMKHIDKQRVYDGYEKALSAAQGDNVARNNIRMMRMAFRYSDLETREDYENDEKGYRALKRYDIPERGELLYMRGHFDSYVSHGGYGISIPVEAEDNGFTPDIWYQFE